MLRVSLSDVPANKLVFVQYLFSLAVTEACREKAVLGTYGENVRLKWPNDLYAVVGDEKKKIGGILVNTSFTGGKAEIIIGSLIDFPCMFLILLFFYRMRRQCT